MRAGVKAGATDDIGFFAVENKVCVPHWHATIPHFWAWHHEHLFFDRPGFKEKLTSTAPARVVKEVLA